MRRGIYFSMDALLATMLLVSGIMAFRILYIAPNNAFMDYTSRDIGNVMADISCQDAGLPYLEQLMENGTLRDNNASFLEKLGELWAQNKKYEMRKLLNDFRRKYLPESEFSVYIQNELVYNTYHESETNIVSAKRMVSGITANRTQTGYIARAIASKAVKNNTLVVMGDVITSAVTNPWGWNNYNSVYVVYTVDIPDGADISDAYWFIEAAWTDNKFSAYINGNYIGSSNGDATFTNLKDYFHSGRNYAEVVYSYGWGGYEGGEDGASHIVVKYTVNTTNTVADMSRHYFADVRSKCSIRYKKPVFISGELDSVYVNMSVNSTNATLIINYNGNDYLISKKSVVNYSAIWSDSEIRSQLAGYGLNYTNFTGKFVWFDVDLDTYESSEYTGNLRELFNKSYIYTEQELSSIVYKYIDITDTVDDYDYSEQQSGDFYRKVNWYYNYSNSSIPLFLKAQFAWLYYTGTTPSQVVKSNHIILYQSPPLIHEFARFGHDGDSVINGRNNFSLSFSYGYAVNPFNSFVTFSYLVPNMVPYGATFDTEGEALNDAKERLNETLGNAIEALNVETEALGIGRVPSLWGPILVEVRSWK